MALKPLKTFLTDMRFYSTIRIFTNLLEKCYLFSRCQFKLDVFKLNDTLLGYEKWITRKNKSGVGLGREESIMRD